jgi:hypothetical protein
MWWYWIQRFDCSDDRAAKRNADLDRRGSHGSSVWFTGLSRMVQTALGENPQSRHVLAFRGRRGDLIKMLYRVSVQRRSVSFREKT